MTRRAVYVILIGLALSGCSGEVNCTPRGLFMKTTGLAGHVTLDPEYLDLCRKAIEGKP